MGIEASTNLCGTESSFTVAAIIIKELTKVDPFVSVLCDFHNTPVNTIFRKDSSTKQQTMYLP